MKSLVLFTLVNCKWCEEAKRYLKSKKIQYKQIELTKNAKALKECQKRCKGAPVFLIGNLWICGFDKEKINKELGIK